MDERDEYTADDLDIVEFDESVFEAVDLSRDTFKKHLEEAATLARDFTRTLVTNTLPDTIAYTIHYGCSYDGNPLVQDEKTFPEDYDKDPITTESAEEVTANLWRDGFVPEWINVTVSREDGQFTHIQLKCCGRYSAMPRQMYHIHEGRPPFHVLGPPMPPDYNREDTVKFNLYWREDA
ncbi:MAG: hypothetical protein CMJ58_15495 [Planctomycetaceae bacterium]|nr:hypothetical protein [Planctomycetaceae bacterium]